MATVDIFHNQLRYPGQLQVKHAVDVDRVSSAIPNFTQVVWVNADLSKHEQVAHYPHFIFFLRKERQAVARLAESSHCRGVADPGRDQSSLS